jgi:hypothetical protein
MIVKRLQNSRKLGGTLGKLAEVVQLLVKITRNGHENEMMFLEKNVRTFDVTFSSSYGACAPRFD